MDVKSFHESANMQSDTELDDENAIKDCSEQPESSTKYRSTAFTGNVLTNKPQSLKRLIEKTNATKETASRP